MGANGLTGVSGLSLGVTPNEDSSEGTSLCWFVSPDHPLRGEVGKGRKALSHCLKKELSVHLSHSCSDSLTGAKHAGSGLPALTGGENALLLQECLRIVLGPAVCLMGFSRILLSLSSS